MKQFTQSSLMNWINIFHWINLSYLKLQNQIQLILWCHPTKLTCHYGDVIMGAIASQITSVTIVCSTVYSDADQRKHQSSGSLVFLWGIHRGLVNSPHKWPVTRKVFPFDDVIMWSPLNWWIPRSNPSFESFENWILSLWPGVTPN